MHNVFMKYDATIYQSVYQFVDALPIPAALLNADYQIRHSNTDFRADYDIQRLLAEQTLPFRDQVVLGMAVRVSAQFVEVGTQKLILLTVQHDPAPRQPEPYQAIARFLSDFAGTHHLGWINAEGLTQVLGYAPDKFSLIDDLEVWVHPEDLQIARQHFQSLQTQKADIAEFRVIRMDQQKRWLRSYLYPILEDETVRFYGIGQDITAAKQAQETLLDNPAREITFHTKAEEQLREYVKELETSVEELDAYALTIAHDLKAPLSGLLGFVEILEYSIGRDKEKVALSINYIRNSSEAMVKMVNQLLWLARLQDPQETFMGLEMVSLVRSVLTRFQSQIESKGIEVRLADYLPTALGHSAWIEELFANLIGNAIHYIGDDNLVPSIDIRGAVEGEMVRYEVEDNGIGIKESDRAKLFKTYSRLETIHREGTGLGLSIVKRIVSKLGGDVGVESEWGKGSTFWFTLPR
jgi:signal transduction histidine kinase